MNDDELGRLEEELIEDEGVTLALKRFDIARHTLRIQQDHPQFYWLLTLSLSLDPEDFRDIGSRMSTDDFAFMAITMANMTALMEGYVFRKMEWEK